MGEPTPLERSRLVKAHAKELGFDLCGIAPTSVPEAYARYRTLMGRGYGAEMRWLFDKPELRRDVRELWPEAKSVVVVAMSYASDVPGYLAQPPAADEGWISRYAQGKDYHVVVRKRLIRLVQQFAADPQLGFGSHAHRVFVDTGPVLEKAFAQAAGIGWVGKNTLLIHKRGGSWYFLGVVLTPLQLAPDEPAVDHCGTCRRCIDVCPTNAIVRPYELDARACISNWTIESPDPAVVIDPATLGQHVFGCDLCQEVCPWNSKATPSPHTPLLPRPENVRPKLADLAVLTEDGDFKARFPRSAVRRVKAHQMAAVVEIIRKTDGSANPE